MTSQRGSSGFTAIEVLVTLFIAVLFIGGAYQLYSYILHNSTVSREQSTASDYSYRALRQYAGQATRPCTPVANPIDASSTIPSDAALPTPTNLSIRIDCPYGTTSDLTRITATLTYGANNNEKKVSHVLLKR